MSFQSVDFAVFLAAVLWLLVMLPGRAGPGMLLGASYLFYGWRQPQYVPLLLFTTVVEFWLVHYFARFPEPGARLRGVWLSALLNFGLLTYFKYLNFGLTSASSILAPVGSALSTPLVAAALPVGISFFTFRKFAYASDVLRHHLTPCRSLSQFALYVSYFPQVLAGPIEPGRSFLPQLSNFVSLRDKILDRLPRAALLFAEGWLRKRFADLLGPSVASFFSGDPSLASGSQALCAIVGFALQIYGDFSGYSRMAQGVSHLLGIELMDNFNLPYLATSLSDFWRRWHISLSNWIREYLHLPLSRRLLELSRRRHRAGLQVASLLITMSLVGLWHGAAWTFVVWGTVHGIFLAVERAWDRPGKVALPRFLARAWVWLVVLGSWVLFRAPDFATALKCYGALANPGWSLPEAGWFCGCLGILACDGMLYWFTKSEQEWKTWKWNLAVSSCAWLLVFCVVWLVWSPGTGATRLSEFIYSQF